MPLGGATVASESCSSSFVGNRKDADTATSDAKNVANT